MIFHQVPKVPSWNQVFFSTEFWKNLGFENFEPWESFQNGGKKTHGTIYGLKISGLLESFQNARALGDGCDDQKHHSAQKEMQNAMAALEDARADPEPDPDPDPCAIVFLNVFFVWDMIICQT